MATDDAWKQLDDLRRKYGKEWRLRPDLYVCADGCERHIILGHTQHNVRTVREYIAILAEACRVVEAANPTWASHYQRPLKPPSKSVVGTTDAGREWPPSAGEDDAG